MSGLIVVRYSRDPIMLRYSFWSIASPSLSSSRAVVHRKRLGLTHIEFLEHVLGVFALVHECPLASLLDLQPKEESQFTIMLISNSLLIASENLATRA
jgi:hypothetical protein